MLKTIVVNSGRPGVSAAAELVTLAVTAIGLILLLPPLGGRGAAIVSLAAYVTGFVYLLVAVLRTAPEGVNDYVLPGRSDLAWARSLLRLRGR
jgi:hypothetical protein